MHMQRSVHARTKGLLLDILAEEGVLIDETPVDRNVTWYYLGPWSLAGTPMPGVAGHVTWHAAPADEAEAAAREDLLQRLRARGALHEGQDQAAHMLGTAGDPQRPDDYTRIGLLRDARKFSAGYKVGDHWFHSDPGSRTQQLGLVIAGQAGLIPQGLQWKTLGGAFVPMTAQLAQQIFAAAMASDAQYHAIGEQARAALAAGTLTDIHAIEWPAGYGEA